MRVFVYKDWKKRGIQIVEADCILSTKCSRWVVSGNKKHFDFEVTFERACAKAVELGQAEVRKKLKEVALIRSQMERYLKSPTDIR